MGCGKGGDGEVEAGLDSVVPSTSILETLRNKMTPSERKSLQISSFAPCYFQHLVLRGWGAEQNNLCWVSHTSPLRHLMSQSELTKSNQYRAGF